MPVKGGKLTPQEAQFIGHLAATGDATYAAKMARYSQPAVQGWQKAHNPAIAEHVRKAQVARLTNDLLPKSLDLLDVFLTDEKRADRVRLAAAQTVLKYTLGASEDGTEKDPAEMSAAEIQARIDQLRRAAADRARPVIEGTAGTIDTAPENDVFG